MISKKKEWHAFQSTFGLKISGVKFFSPLVLLGLETRFETLPIIATFRAEIQILFRAAEKKNSRKNFVPVLFSRLEKYFETLPIIVIFR